MWDSLRQKPYIFNCDGSVSTNEAGFEYNLCCADGSWIFGVCGKCGEHEVLLIELLPQIHGIKFVIFFRILGLHIYIDSKKTLRLIMGGYLPFYRHLPIILVIKQNFYDNMFFSFNNTLREGNVIADWLAKRGVTDQSKDVKIWTSSQNFF